MGSPERAYRQQRASACGDCLSISGIWDLAAGGLDQLPQSLLIHSSR